ncbi:uncharacterized protein LOC127260749 [Andrographis paniculata]|uniref:uncharacterized protein LOC127260749 n=1 Tax=Andrographis paniculata TaxID=175694 RepID=UPI0021E9A543|nr:uncharacterized protein LOC127260749 [Andrographis paniculata]
MSAHSLNLCGVLSETKRIISAHSRHFLALSVFFLLPLSFSLVVYPLLWRSPPTLSHHHRSLFSYTSSDPDIPSLDEAHLLLPSVYALFVLLFSLCGTASITYSTFHGFYGRPVKLIASIKSVLFSILPLIVTLVLVQIIVGLVAAAFGGFTALVYNGFVLLGFEIDYRNAYFAGLLVVIVALLLGVLIFLKVEWYLSSVVVVVESRWGLSPLKRSSYLVKGMRKVVVLMILLFGALIGFLAMLCASLVPNVDGNGIREGWISWAFIFQTVLCTAALTIVMLYNVAANAVLFMYCKALRGELAFEIAEEFAREYVSLPFDDGKAPHVVYVV